MLALGDRLIAPGLRLLNLGNQDAEALPDERFQLQAIAVKYPDQEVKGSLATPRV